MLSCSRIVLQQIDWQDDTYSLTPLSEPPLPERFLHSITRTAILHPPILKKKEQDLYQIVSGRKRLLAAKEFLHKTTLDCLILPKYLPEMETLAYALEDALLSGPLSPVQQAMFCQIALPHLDKKRVAEQYLPLVGLAPHPYTLEKLLPLLSLEEQIVLAVHGGNLDPAVALELTELSFTDRMALFEVIEYLNLSVSNQKKITSICRELARRNAVGVMNIIADHEAQAILSHSSANLPQKSANLMNWLTRKQLPRLSDAESQFNQFAGRLGLPKKATISHAPSFETDALRVTLNFANKEELLAVWPAIKTALEKRVETTAPHKNRG